MTSATSNANIIIEIEAALPNIPEDSEDKRVLRYVASALTPEAVEKRSEEDRDLTHLHQVARDRMRRRAKEASHD